MAEQNSHSPNSTGRTWRERIAVFGPASIVTIAALAIAYHFVQPAPPHHIVLAAGPQQGAYAYYGRLYRDLLAQEGIEVTLDYTEGSIENIALLRDHKADVAFIQGGAGKSVEAPHLRSLASVYFEPIWVFLRKGEAISRLGDLRGHRVALDKEGSGTRAVALELLADNGIHPNDFESVPLGGAEAAQALRDGKVDASFFVVAARAGYVHDLLVSPEIHLLSIDRAAAYKLHHSFLSTVTMPEGAADIATDLPGADTVLLATAANLVARDDFHPALAELMLRKAKDIFGQGGLFEEAGQFPSRKYLEYPISGAATAFFNAGPSLLQRYLPFWAANLVDRFKIMLLPLITLAYPFIKVIPPTYDWRMRSRINRWYKELQAIEPASEAHPSFEEIKRRLDALDHIERNVQRLTMPVSYGGPLYTLRLHIALLRSELREAAEAPAARRREPKRTA